MTRLWCAQAWVGGGWAPGVLLEADAQGRWARIEFDTEAGTARVLTADEHQPILK